MVWTLASVMVDWAWRWRGVALEELSWTIVLHPALSLRHETFIDFMVAVHHILGWWFRISSVVFATLRVARSSKLTHLLISPVQHGSRWHLMVVAAVEGVLRAYAPQRWPVATDVEARLIIHVALELGC